jgi:hypothetical protein
MRLRFYDPEQERAYAEQVLREQMAEWTQEDEQEQDEAFNCASAAGFDPPIAVLSRLLMNPEKDPPTHSPPH